VSGKRKERMVAGDGSQERVHVQEDRYEEPALPHRSLSDVCSGSFSTDPAIFADWSMSASPRKQTLRLE
jgi:hypothetical protein